MAGKVVLLTGDLLFGSKVESMIREAGYEPALPGAEGVALAVVDLTDAATDAAAARAEALAGADLPTLAYYAHTDDDVRKAALGAGFDKVVPRSRMMREGAALIAQLTG